MQPSRNWSALGSEVPCVVALLLPVCIQAHHGQLGILLCMYFNCSCMKMLIKVPLLSGSSDTFNGEYSGSQAAKLESRFQTRRAEVFGYVLLAWFVTGRKAKRKIWF